MEQTINVSGKQYKISSDVELSTLQMTDVIKQIEKISCNNCGSNIKTLTATCNRKTAKTDDVIVMTVTGTGGSPNYSIVFKKGGTAITGCSYTNVPSGTEKTCSYKVLSTDTYPIIVSVLITDSMNQTCTESCSITLTPPSPTCDFKVT